jgi:hypothetical protein
MSTTEEEKAAILRNYFAALGKKGGKRSAETTKRDYSAIGKAGAKSRWAGHVKREDKQK